MSWIDPQFWPEPVFWAVWAILTISVGVCVALGRTARKVPSTTRRPRRRE